MAFTITTDDEVNIYAGENVDSTPTAAQKEAVEDHMISRLSGWARVNVATSYAGWTSTVKELLSEYLARQIAITIIAFNMAGYTSRIEAEDILNVNIFNIRLLEKDFLKDQQFWTWVKK